jgi:two-component system phosphate regulon sensor histidine kinase PhoR
VDREQGGVGRRALARQALIAAAPGIAAFALLAAFEQVAMPTALLGGFLCLAGGAWLARRQRREVEAIADRIAGLAQGQDHPPLPEVTGPVSDRLRRPIGDVARQLRRRSGRMAAQARMLESVIEALPDPIIVVDQELTVVQANAAARRSFDAPGPTLPLARILRDPGVLAAATAALTGTSASSVSFTPSSDRTKQFSARIEPVDLGDRRRGALLALREQTEEVMIERMRSDFVANASHEIRTPLASIQGFIETLRGPARHDSQARDSFLEIMGEEADRMARLVDDLLSLSRIELAAHQPPRERCDLREVVTHAVDRLRATADQGGVRVELDLPEGLPAVTGDTDQLHQLFVNLVDNAIKYGGEGTTVRVTARALAAAPADSGAASGRPCVRVAIADQGPGIAPEHLPRLTERFYRVDSGRSRRLRGTGLGLAIVKHILRRHQGHLAIESRVGLGSTFAVLLPTVEGQSGTVTTLS